MTRTQRRPARTKAVAVSLMLAMTSNAWALPTGGAVSAGGATVTTGAGTMTVNQTTQNAAINWQGFSIGQGEAVRFVQPNSASVALNRVLGSDPSSILGSLSANGKVFLVNPNGILFGAGAQVNVGALVASTLNITDADFMAGRYRFSGPGGGAVVNQGSINAADGGFVALLGANVSNEGVIAARLGSVALAAGNGITLDVAGDGLLQVAVDQGAMNAMVQNGGLIQADGGRVLMSTQGAGTLLQTVVNNTGVIQARTLQNRNGTILLLGDMENGTASVGGTLDASAPNGGNGGFIETSAARVDIANDARVTTAATPAGVSGTWLIDPQDFTIAPVGGNITGAALSTALNLGNVTIANAAGPGNGDIFINDTIGAAPLWNGGAGTTTLTLNASRDVIQAAGADITATRGNLVINAPRNVTLNAAININNGTMVVCCGQDITVAATSAITMVNASVLLSAGRDIFMNGTMSTTDGNTMMCAGHDINIVGATTQTRSSAIAGESLAGAPYFLPLGLTLVAGNAATGPGLAGGGGSVNITPVITVTNAPVNVTYNPLTYSAPVTPFAGRFTAPAPLTVRRLVFPEVADKASDGTTTATLTSLFRPDANGLRPTSLSLAGAGTANFLTTTVGLNQPVDFSGFTLAGANAADFALPINCCTQLGRTSGTFLPLAPLAAVGSLIATVPPLVVAGMVPSFLDAPSLNLAVVESEAPLFSFAREQVEEAPAAIAPAAAPVPRSAPFVAPVPRPARQGRN